MMKKIKILKLLKKISIHLLVLTVLCLPLVTLAVTSGGPPTKIPIDIKNPVSGASTLIELLTLILNNIVMPIAVVAVVVWIIWAGFTYLTAQGKPAEIEKAHKRLLWSLVGAGILLGAGAISLVVQNTVKSITTP